MDITAMLVRDYLAVREEHGVRTVRASELIDFVSRHNGNVRKVRPLMLKGIGWVQEGEIIRRAS